jgi:excisionase family DNA binding protein
MTPPAYNYQTAAEWLNITPHKLRRLVELRKIPFVKIEREVRFRLEDLEQYVAGCVRPAIFTGGLRLTPPPGVGTFQRKK